MDRADTQQPPVVIDLAAQPAMRCPCGWARRAFGDVPNAPCSVHRVDIAEDARAHYHKDHTGVCRITFLAPVV